MEVNMGSAGTLVERLQLERARVGVSARGARPCTELEEGVWRGMSACTAQHAQLFLRSGCIMNI